MLQDVIKNIQLDFDDVIKYDEVGFGLAKLAAIDELLRNNPEVNSSPQNKELLESMRAQLELVCLPNLDDDRCLDILRENFILALTMPGYDLEEKLSQKIIFKELDDLEIEFAEKLLKVLTENEGKIGNSDLTMGGRTLPPSLKNWFLDYFNFPARSIFRTNLEEVEYMNKSKNVGLLDKTNREVLLEAIKLRDTIFNLVQKYKSLPETDDEKLAFKGFNLYKWLPGLGEEDMASLRINAPFKVRDELAGGVAPTEDSNYIVREKFELPEVLSSAQNMPAPAVPVRPVVGVESEKLKVESGNNEKIAVSSRQVGTPRNDRFVMPPLTVKSKVGSGNGEADIQEILKRQAQGGAGLRLGGGGQITNDKLLMTNGGQGQITNDKLLMTNGRVTGDGLQVTEGKKPEVKDRTLEIDEKLEDLRKKTGGRGNP